MNHSCSFTLPTIISAVSRCNGSMITRCPSEVGSFTSIFGQAIPANLLDILTGISPDYARSFIDNYFRNIHPIYPCTELSSIMEMYDGIKANSHRAMEELLIAMVLAMGMDVCGRKQEAAFLAHNVSRHASSYFRATINEKDRLLDIQGLLLLTTLSLFFPEVGLTWHYAGLTISRAISCGIHREPKPSETRGSSKKALERCRDLFWSAYSLDR